MQSRSFTQVATLEVIRLIEPLADVDGAVTILMRELGWKSASGDALEVDLGNLGDLASGLIDKARVLADAETEEETERAALDLAKDIPPFLVELRSKAPVLETALKNLDDLVGPTAELAKNLFARLIDFLVYEYLARYHPRVFASLHLVGLMDRVVDEFGTAVRTVYWDRIGLVFTNPIGLANATYKWATEFDGDEFLKRIDVFMRAFLLPGGVYRQDPKVQAALGRDPGAREVRIPLYQGGRWPMPDDTGPSSYFEVDLNLSPVPRVTRSGVELLPGLAAYPSLSGVAQAEESVGGGWKLRLRTNANLTSGVAVELRPPHDLTLTTDLFRDSPLSGSELRLEAGISKAAESRDLSYIFGTRDGSHLAVREAGVNLIVALQRGEPELAIELAIKELTLAISGSDGDGFIQELLSGIDILSQCDLTFGYSNREGAYFRGSGALEIEIPLHAELGPFTIDSLLIGLGIDDGFEIILAASFSAELGPVSAAVKRIGLLIPFDFRSDGRDGNLGPLQIEAPKFKPPEGAGLSIDAGGIVGGGFLDIDNVNKRYAGILGLNFGEIGLTAIGLIATRMPDGSDGFALLINIGVTFDPPIQLSMGFTLAGVGGLIGINRTMDILVLQKGIKNRTLDSILFPDPATVVANADKIISDLQSVFPVTEGRFVVGPMVKIGYGTPALITADIGIFIDLPEPIRIVLMGQVEATFPEPKSPVVEVHLDVLGVLDFQKEEITFQASLYDSTILVYELYGDSAFILGWGRNKRFALSLGGFHPKFTPPPPPIIFADLKRLTLCISKSKDFQLSAKSYQALTPNSLQFGCRVDLYAAFSGAEVTGFLGFETLIYFSPFSFEAWIGAGVCVKYQGATLCDVHLSLNLSGPGAWCARGTAKVSICFLPDINVSFNYEWGDDRAPTLKPVNAWPRLKDALQNPGSWSAVVPSRDSIVERLREREGEDKTKLVVHPLGQLEVRQNVVPLGMKLDKIANAPVAVYKSFDIKTLTSGVDALTTESVDDYFAPGQFKNLTDHQRLSLPSFEKMKAGVRVTSGAATFNGDCPGTAIEYESLLLDDDRTSSAPETAGKVDTDAARRVVRTIADRRAGLRAGKRARFGQLSSRPRVKATDDRYCVANAADLTRATLGTNLGPNSALTRIAAEQAMAEHVAASASPASRFTVVPEYEVVTS